jgi:hypothetical protein
MPNRFLVAIIILFWVGANGWLVYRDIVPWLGPGEPPPFTIDLAEEALAHSSDIRWRIVKEGKEKGHATTSVRYRSKDDTYELRCEFKLWSGERGPGTDPDQLIRSMYRVTREGELREIRAGVSVVIKPAAVSIDISGVVKDRKLYPRVEIRPAGLEPIEQELAPVEVSSRGNVLNPMQPVNRITGLRKGQKWRMPLVDPLADVAQAYNPLGHGKKALVGQLEAEVLRETHTLLWGANQEQVPCLVIEYRGDDTSARTWVRESDFTVLQQEVNHHGDKLILVRE